MKKIRIGLLAAVMCAIPALASAQDEGEEGAAAEGGEEGAATEAEEGATGEGEEAPVGEGVPGVGADTGGLAAICQIDPDACPKLDMEKEAKKDLNEKIYAVQQIYAKRKMRFELNPYWSITLNDQFVQHPGPGIAGNFYLFEVFAIGANFNYYNPFNVDSDFNADVRRAARVGVPLTEYNWGANFNLTYVPAYGKFAGFSDFIFHWDLYLVAGGGVISSRPIAVSTRTTGLRVQDQGRGERRDRRAGLLQPLVRGILEIRTTSSWKISRTYRPSTTRSRPRIPPTGTTRTRSSRTTFRRSLASPSSCRSPRVPVAEVTLEEATMRTTTMKTTATTRRLLLAISAGIGLLAATETAQAQEILLTGPLAGAPAVRKLRLYRQAGSRSPRPRRSRCSTSTSGPSCRHPARLQLHRLALARRVGRVLPGSPHLRSASPRRSRTSMRSAAAGIRTPVIPRARCPRPPTAASPPSTSA
jgi:hypothetical protein